MAATLTVMGADGLQTVELDAEAYRALGQHLIDMAKLAGEGRHGPDAKDVETAASQPGTAFMREQPSDIVQLKEGPVRDDSSPLQDLQSGEWLPASSEELAAWNKRTGISPKPS